MIFIHLLMMGVIKKYKTEEMDISLLINLLAFGKKVSPKVIIFSNPNNPTGHVISNDEI